ncbi:MAG: S26 family signal peptidase [Parvularculaceae bacterium]|nr:S26 family signal peptidase [Parvularculaceae bacterium]
MRRGATIILAASGVAIAALAFASAHPLAPMLVWNASASAPIGLYRIKPNTQPEIGAFVLVRPDEDLEKFITERGYLPKDIPLLKRVAALPGDGICRDSKAVYINETRVADALNFDSRGRKMPAWSGCFTLRSDEIFLLNDPENSIDGRYFGATRLDDVIGVARAVWVRR